MDMLTYKNEVLKYALKDILQAKARVTMKREIRKNGIAIDNNTNTKSLEGIYNLLKRGKNHDTIRQLF